MNVTLVTMITLCVALEFDANAKPEFVFELVW